MALEKEIAAYEAKSADLEKNHNGKFVVFKDDTFVGAFDTFDAAAKEAVRQFGAGPYLIRQVGANPPALPASVLYALRDGVSARVAPHSVAFASGNR